MHFTYFTVKLWKVLLLAAILSFFAFVGYVGSLLIVAHVAFKKGRIYELEQIQAILDAPDSKSDSKDGEPGTFDHSHDKSTSNFNSL